MQDERKNIVLVCEIKAG